MQQNSVYPRRALLLVNLGTPEAPTTPAVRTYLREFLSDPRVLTMPALFRWLLLNLIILPFRPKRSAAAYKKVWTEGGSPLLVETRSLTDAVRALVNEQMGTDVVVEFAMRYGNPSLKSVLDKLIDAGVNELTVMPLYPQYASASTTSTIERVNEILAERWVYPAVRFIGEFCDEPGYINALAEVAKERMARFGGDHVVFSFHGIPDSHVTRGDTTGAHCLAKSDCCDHDVPPARMCYRAHCFRTARALAAALNIGPDDYTLCFQSRLTREPWLLPETVNTLERLAGEGKKKITIFSPAFVADCLETLEELDIEARKSFLAAGGDDFLVIPCVNSHPLWAQGVVDIVQAQGGFPRRATKLSVIAEPATARA